MQTEHERPQAPARWAELLRKAVDEPGTISKAYSAMHDYSLGNQLLAMFQCATRGIEPGPISTYPGWQNQGRQVRKGQRALTLCMPVSFAKARKSDTDEDGEEVKSVACMQTFVYRPNWFVVSQTDRKPGAPELAPAPLPQWDKSRALQTLGIAEESFSLMTGNAMGYARGQTVAVSPLAFNPHKTLMHELAHCLMHSGERTDTERVPHNLEEVEAESVALLVCESLGLGELAECRGYIQSWLGSGQTIPDRSAQRVFTAADRILKAGRPAKVQAAA
ncbi:MAG: ArdC-like ssDNA-binding domain-containing protein [Chloroflexota bacterium]